MKLLTKIYSPWLIIPGVALLILVLALMFRPESNLYKLDSGESLQLLRDSSLKIGIQDLPGKQLVDVRTPELFSQGHPADAVNIPVRQLLEKESLEFFDNLYHNGKTAVLYGSDELQATAPLFLLRQMGYDNLLMLAGGFSLQKGFKEPEVVSKEIPVITSDAFLKNQEKTAATETTKPKSTTIIPVRKKVTSGGGC